MEVGDKVTFSFGKEQKEGIIHKIYPKTVYIKVDFPHHPGKIVKRSLAQLQDTSRQKKKSPKKPRRRAASKEKTAT